MSSNLDFLAGGGEMGARVRDFDWADTPLGDPAHWPQPLKTLVGVMLAAEQPMFVTWGPQHTLLYNDGYVTMLADRHPRALARPFFAVWTEVAQTLIPLFDRVMRGEPVHMSDIELYLERPGRPQEAHFAFSYTPVRDESGAVVGLFCPCTETTEQVLAERERVEAASRLKILNDSLASQVDVQSRELNRLWNLSRDPFVICDADGRWLRASPVWTEILGWTQAELLGRTSQWMEHPDDQQKTRGKVHDVSGGEVLLAFENRFRDRAGHFRTFSWTAVPDGDLLYCVARDVTQERALEAERTALEAQLRQSQKMEAVGQLTGGLAHDFNNLLAGISGSLEMLDIRVQQGRIGEIDRYVHASQSAARRAAALTHRLLAFSRRQTLDPKPTDVNRLISGMSELIQRAIGPEIRFESVSAAGLWATVVDPGQLENALLNLCINARDAMPNGGQLIVETGNKWLDDRAARARDLPPGQYISVCVSDTGTGMSADISARAFDPFFTTKPIGVGTGLGLSMVYGFVRQSGGQVRIYSEIDKGTMVCLYLPRHLGESEDDRDEFIETGVISAEHSETVLIVDDEPTVRMLVVDVVQEMGCLALEAQDGAAGLKVLNSGAKIDLLITDVGLPGGLNGRQLADAARQNRPDLKVLFITGYAENAVLSHGHLAPSMHVLTKPFTIDDLTRRVKQLLAE